MSNPELFIIGLFALALIPLLAYLMYKSTAPFFVKLSTVAVVSILLITSSLFVYNRLGAPIDGYPPEKFTYVSHVVVSSERIELWAITDKKGSRLYYFPYDAETAKELEKAQQEQESGNNQEGEFDLKTDNPSVTFNIPTPGENEDSRNFVKPATPGEI